MHVPGPFQERAQNIYTKLRDNLIRNVYKVKYILYILIFDADIK